MIPTPCLTELTNCRFQVIRFGGKEDIQPMPKSVYKFQEQTACDHKIVEAENGTVIGELRVKPSSLLWKSKGEHQYRSVGLDDFVVWVKGAGKPASK